MEPSFLTNFSQSDLKELIKIAVQEVVSEKNLPNNSSLPEILNIDQAAKFVGLKKSTVYEKTSYQEIPHYKRGGKLYFLRSELEAWIKAGKVKTNYELQIEAANYALKKKSEKGK